MNLKNCFSKVMIYFYDVTHCLSLNNTPFSCAEGIMDKCPLFLGIECVHGKIIYTCIYYFRIYIYLKGIQPA